MVRAEDYDEFVNYASRLPETDAEVAGLSRLADGGRALELGAGTGRVAIPLAATGVDVHAIEIDPAMIAQLNAKPNSHLVSVHPGDMADVDAQGSFDLIYAVFGTLFMLPTQQTQVRCFRNAAARLAPGGTFLVEALMPGTGGGAGSGVTNANATDDRVILNVTESDPVAQTIDTRQVAMSAAGIEIHPVHVRYSWPSELDLMAQLGGMRRRARWSSWQQHPFTADDQRHISLYELDD